MNNIVFEYATLLLNRRGYKTKKNNNNLYGINADGKEIICYFVENAKVTIDVIKTILSTSKIKHILIIYSKSLTPDAKQAISLNKIFLFEIFSYDELSYDPISIVPKHTKINKKPKEWHKFPIILNTDIIARYYGFQRGDVIAIDEENGLNYRKCM